MSIYPPPVCVEDVLRYVAHSGDGFRDLDDRRRAGEEAIRDALTVLGLSPDERLPVPQCCPQCHAEHDS